MFRLFVTIAWVVCLASFTLTEGHCQDPLEPDTVRLGNLAVDLVGPPYHGSAVLPVIVFNDEYLRELMIPLEWWGPLSGDSGAFTGVREAYTELGGITVEPKSAVIYFNTPYFGPFCPPAGDTLALLYFSIEDTGPVEFDSTQGGLPSNYLHFYDSLFNHIGPYFERPVLYHISAYEQGDVNQDGVVNVGDIVFLVTYLYRSGPPPDVLELGDVNGDCLVDVGDVVYLLNYLYRAGPVPRNGCSY